MLSTRLMKMMLDECILDNDLQDAFRASSLFDVCTSFELGYQPKEPDENLVAGTITHGRILLTKDKKTITPRKYPLGTHKGIVQVRRCEAKHPYVLGRLEALFVMGIDGLVEGNFTLVYFDKIKILTNEGEIVKYFADYEELKYLVQGNGTFC